MAIIELQVSASAFLGAQRNALRSLALCPPALPSVDGVQVLVDRIDFGANALRHHEEADFPAFYEHRGEAVPTPNPCSGFRTQLAQDVTLHLTTEQEVLAAPNGSPAVVVPVRVTLVFDLDLYTVGDDCYLRASLRRVEFGPLPPLPPPFSPLTTLPDAVCTQIETFLTDHARLFASSGTVPLGLNALRKGVRVLNAGLSVNAQMQRVAFRVQIGGSHTNLDVPWSNFFRGHFPDRLQGSDWSLFVEAGMLTETAKALVYQELPRDPNLEAFPGCTYSRVGGRAVLELDALLIYHLYRNVDLDIDLTASVHPRVHLHLWVDTPNWISTEIDFSGLLQSNDPLVNLALTLARFMGVPVEEILFRVAGSMAMAELSNSPLENCKQPSPTTIRCDKRFRVPHVPGALQTALTGLLALDDGVALVGTMSVRELTPGVVETRVREFQVHAPSVSCGAAGMSLVAAFGSDPSNFAVLHAQAYVGNQGTAPLRLCGPPAVVRGADGPFPAGAVRVDGQRAPLTVRIDLASPPAAYYDAHYPLDLLIRTSGGTRLVRLQPPPRVTTADHERMVAELVVKVGDCHQLLDPWFRTHRGYNPLWSPRPPADAVVRHLWQVVVSGLPAGETVTLLDGDERPVASAVSTGRVVRLSTMAVPATAGNELSVIRGSTLDPMDDDVGPVPEPATREAGDLEAGGDEARGRGLEVRQTNLVHVGSVALPGRCRRLVLAEILGAPCVVAITVAGMTAFDVGASKRVVVMASWPAEGVNGALRWHGGMVIFGDEGLARVDGAGRRTRETPRCAHPVLDAAGDHHGLYAVTEEGIDVYSPRLCPVARVPIEGATSVACVNGHVLVGGRRGLGVLAAVGRQSETDWIDVGDGAVTSLAPAPLAGPGVFLITSEDGRFRLLRFGEHDLEELAMYEAPPWFAGAVRLGDRLIMAGEAETLDLYELGETAVV